MLLLKRKLNTFLKKNKAPQKSAGLLLFMFSLEFFIPASSTFLNHPQHEALVRHHLTQEP